jgi:hypothetical protein
MKRNPTAQGGEALRQSLSGLAKQKGIPAWVESLPKRDQVPPDHFLEPKARKFPYKNPDGSLNRSLVRAAISRAAQHGYEDIEKRARKIYAKIVKASELRRGMGKQKEKSVALDYARATARAWRLEECEDLISWSRAIKAVSTISETEKKRREKISERWDELVNMSGRAVLNYAASDLGKKSGLSFSEAARQGITSGRQRPRQIARLKGKPKKSWTADDWDIASRIVNFITRMRGNPGSLYDEKGKPTRKLMSLLIWGHDPRREKNLNPLAALSMDMSVVEFEKNLSPFETIYRRHGDQMVEMLKSAGVDLSRYSRVIRVVPSVERIDLESDITMLDALRKGWDFYATNGNICIEHLASPTRDEAKAQLNAMAQGYGWNSFEGKTFYEIGRPIPGTFNHKDCSFFAYIYAPDEKAVATNQKNPSLTLANWFWDTLHTTPPRVWRPSIGGWTSRPVPGVALNRDPSRHIERKQVVSVIKDYVWLNTTMTAQPVNHFVPPVEMVRDS